MHIDGLTVTGGVTNTSNCGRGGGGIRSVGDLTVTNSRVVGNRSFAGLNCHWGGFDGGGSRSPAAR